jgi:hypothetical protein
MMVQVMFIINILCIFVDNIQHIQNEYKKTSIVSKASDGIGTSRPKHQTCPKA